VEHLQQIDRHSREAELRDYLGRFGFSNDMALSKIENFSGGEKSRLVLSMLIYQRPNLLLLDEPTNHLDLEMREALAEALQEFSGAMVIVSHDRHLLNSTCDQLLLVNQQSVKEFPLGLDEYPRWLSEHNAALSVNTSNDDSKKANNSTKTLTNKERKRLEAEQRQKTLPLRKRIQKLENDMQKISNELIEIEQMLSNSDIYTDQNKQRLQQLLLKKAEFDKSHDTAETEWFECTEELENFLGNQHNQ
jgi:ATP-binding cassette subfamily F protein 3